MPILLNRTIRLFLDSIGRREEYEYYLEKFHSSRTAAFAILCPSPRDFDSVAQHFTFDLDTLMRLDLFPVILLCGEQAAAMRHTLEEQEHPWHVFEWTGGLDQWSDAVVDDMVKAVEQGKTDRRITLLVLPGQSWLTALPALIPRMARRVHFIRPAGPLRRADGQPLLFYYTVRPDTPALVEEDQPLADLAAALLQTHPSAHVSVASPWQLIEELFTVKGAGCVIRKGSIIDRYAKGQWPDPARLAALLEDSFRRPLARPDSLHSIDEAYIERNYLGAALLEKTDMGMYLSKFAVGMEARGAGLAQELWDELIRDHQHLFWRARSSNPINQWYEKQADGYFKTDAWRIFWRGVRPEDVTPIIQYSLSRPEDFTAPAART